MGLCGLARGRRPTPNLQRTAVSLPSCLSSTEVFYRVLDLPLTLPSGVSTGHKDPKLRWMADETQNLERHEILISINEENDVATSWYAIASVLKDCIDFIHDATESAYRRPINT